MRYMELIRSCVFFLFILLCITVNIIVSQMSIVGAVINVMPILILHPSLKLPWFDKLFIFFVLNILIGPFISFNFDELKLVNLGRIDYFIGNLIIIYYLFVQNRYNIKRSHCIFIFLLSVFLFFSFVFDSSDLIVKFNEYYGFYSKLSVAFSLYLIVSNLDKITNGYVKQLLFLLVFLHLSLSIIQLFYPFYIRIGSIESGIHIGGRLFNRPLGFFESSYVYGVHTIFLCYLFIKVCGRGKINDLVVILLCLVSFLSTRSALLAFVVFLFFVSIRKIYSYQKYVIMFLGSLCFIYLMRSNVELFLVDQSNSTKLLLWYLTLKEFFFNSTFTQLLFGHGMDSASYISLALPNFVNELSFDAVYDNRVDLREGFPIHNVYVQTLFEHGILVFFAVIVPVFKSIQYSLKRDTDLFLVFLLLTIFFQYLLHNGIFAVYLYLICLIGLGNIKNAY